jgi:hypothetical protein
MLGMPAGSVLKDISTALASAGSALSLPAQMSKSMLTGFPLPNAVLDAMASAAGTSMLGMSAGSVLGPMESVSVLNKLISSAGVQVSITPTIYEVVTSILRDGYDESAVSEDILVRPTFGPSTRDKGPCRGARSPDLVRAALQIWATFIYCAYIAELQLSENELTKILLEWFANVGFLAPAYLVWRIAGKGYDTLFSPADPDKNEII